jgi:hypothetical protein
MNPQLFAGWVGIFITGLNLIPIGQLDGGHILYCLIGKPAHFVARGLFFLAAGVVAYSYFFGDNSFMSWWLMLLLIWMFGTRHPPTANDSVPLGPVRIVLGWLTLMFIFIGLTPTPIAEFKPKPRAQVERSVGQEGRDAACAGRAAFPIRRIDQWEPRLAWRVRPLPGSISSFHSKLRC